MKGLTHWLDGLNKQGLGDEPDAAPAVWKNLVGNGLDSKLGGTYEWGSNYINFKGPSKPGYISLQDKNYRSNYTNNGTRTIEIVFSLNAPEELKMMYLWSSTQSGGSSITIRPNTSLNNHYLYVAHHKGLEYAFSNSDNLQLTKDKIYYVNLRYDFKTRLLSLYNSIDNKDTIISISSFKDSTLSTFIGAEPEANDVPNYTYNLNGKIYAFTYYNRCLTDDEFRANLAYYKNRFNF